MAPRKWSRPITITGVSGDERRGHHRLYLAGLVGFGTGAYLSATGERTIGIVLMAGGLAFQVLALLRMRKQD